MNQSSFLSQLLATMIVAGLIGGCASPGARVPCDGPVEPINLPETKSQSASKSPNSRTRKEPP